MTKETLKEKWEKEEAIFRGFVTARDIKGMARLMRDTLAEQKKISTRFSGFMIVTSMTFLVGIGFDIWYFHWINWGYVVSGILSLVAPIIELFN